MHHWTEKYIGRKWSPEYDCSALAVEVLEERYGREIDLPQALDWRKFGAVDARRIAAEFASEVVEPSCGDGILMRVQGNRRSLGSHIGIAVHMQRGVWCLHNLERIGVVFQPLAALPRNNLQIMGFYRWTAKR